MKGPSVYVLYRRVLQYQGKVHASRPFLLTAVFGPVLNCKARMQLNGKFAAVFNPARNNVLCQVSGEEIENTLAAERQRQQ